MGKHPTDRGKNGVKPTLLVEGDGGPLAVVIAGAKVHDAKLLTRTLQAMGVPKPKPTPRQKQHMCLDKGYDNPTGRAAATYRGYTPHIRRIGEDKLDGRGRKRHPARR